MTSPQPDISTMVAELWRFLCAPDASGARALAMLQPRFYVVNVDPADPGKRTLEFVPADHPGAIACRIGDTADLDYLRACTDSVHAAVDAAVIALEVPDLDVKTFTGEIVAHLIAKLGA